MEAELGRHRREGVGGVVVDNLAGVPAVGREVAGQDDVGGGLLEFRGVRQRFFQRDEPVPPRCDAPQELAQAQQKLARAEAAMQRGHYEHARILAEQAEADAKLAWTVAENVRVQRSAAEVHDGTRALREEMERKGQ